MAIRTDARADHEDGKVIAEFRNDNPALWLSAHLDPDAAMTFAHQIMRAVDALKHHKKPNQT